MNRKVQSLVVALDWIKNSVDNLRVTVLVEDSASIENPNLVAKHGLSILVEAIGAGLNLRILMDAGPPADLALRNASIMGIDLKNIDAIFISHGHYDHAGGLLEVLKIIGRPTPIIAHPRIFQPKIIFKPKLTYIGPQFDEATLKVAGGIPILCRGPVKVSAGVSTSGEIARETRFEKVKGFWTLEDGQLVEDPILDDQALYINVRGKGLVVISGCAHSGIVNTLRHIQRVAGVDSLYAIIGGLHLAKAEDEKIRMSIDEVERLNPKAIYPCHCTGLKAIHYLLERFKDRCRPICTGDTIEL
ncbi:MAG: MBL fold metallo-hydrolase [Candidatus Bathyarchaeia archaeon]